MFIISRNRFVIYLFLSSLLISCRDKEVKVHNQNEENILSKKERFDLFIESPIKINTNNKIQKLNNIKFHKSYILSENPHSNSNGDSILKAYSNSYVSINDSQFNEGQDSIIRISSNADVIEVFKNKYVERIIYMRMKSQGIKLNYGIYLGMTLDSFTNLFPLKINENHVSSYINEESFEVKFIFDKEDKKLKEFNYMSIMD